MELSSSAVTVVETMRPVPRLESLEIACRRFQKFNSNYIESIKIARRRYPPRDTNFPHWASSGMWAEDAKLKSNLEWPKKTFYNITY